MGNCCDNDQNKSKNIYSTKALLDMKNFNGMDFYFSTENLSRLEGECLVVFSDHKLKMKKSNLADKMSRTENRKVREYLEAYLHQNSINYEKMYSEKSHTDTPTDTSSQNTVEADFLQIDIDLASIKFSKLIVVFVEPWEGKKSIKRPMEEKLMRALKQICSKGISSVALVEFDDGLGVPVNIGANILARSIFNFSTELKIATVCCSNISDQLSYLSYFQNFKEDVTMSSYTRQSIGQSNYY